MPPWISRDGVAPVFQMVAQVIQRVAVFGENEQLAAAVGQFLELGPRQAFLKRGEFGIVGLVAHAAGAGKQFLQRGDFGAELVEFNRGGELVGQLVALGFVEVVLILLGVGHAALQLGEPAGALRGRQVFQFVQQRLLLFETAADGFENGQRRTGQAALQDGAGERDALLLAAAGLRQELVDVGGDGLVEVVFLAVQPERDGVGVAVGKQALALHVLQVFLQPAQRPRAIRAEAENVAADFAGLVAEPRAVREKGRGQAAG